MPLFKYKAVTPEGRVVEGQGEFPSVLELYERLSAQGLTLISYKTIKEEVKKGFEINIPLPFGSVSERDWSLLCRQLSVLVGAGVSIVEAIELVAEQMQNKKLRKALMETAKDIEEGSSIHDALAKRKNIFPEFLINLVEVGEETGELDLVLRRAAEYYEKIAFIKGKIKSASFYPTFVMIFATAIVWFILTFVVPKFAEIYKSLGGTLPAPTQLLIDISLTLQRNIPYILGTLLISVAVFLYFYRTNLKFRALIHRILLRLPVFGGIFKKGAFARFARTMATLFASGVPLERVLEISGRVVGFIPIEKALNEARKEVLEGKNLWMALQNTEMFPKMIIAMVRVGEETGQMDQMLNSIANFYEEEVDRSIEGLVALIEPALIVILGVIIGAILIALYLPIFNIGSFIIR
ncbi:type II secretion system F family protein [Aquifex aeolicus]|uniref:Fimbrial assembly protein PilC n=1 Tax=Aquifex aeolicus (strain VF5) TaxID=224324 RepID=O66951_AQUAE|nr:type II secretion system F family protein [Aquifex aeolicus]AAC06902.1 fimbrial assembly protein PilC [Aquifex aeolicus VF5]